MNQKGCFITYLELVDKVKEVVRNNDFIVSDVEKFKKSDKPCYVWIVDEGGPCYHRVKSHSSGLRY